MSQDAKFTYRRKFPRKSFRKIISIIHSGVGEVVEGVEIGEGGVSFRSKKEIVLENQLIVNFFLPDGDFFSIQTTLKNIGDNGSDKIYGVSFNEVSIALKRQIRAYVARTASSLSIF